MLEVPPDDKRLDDPMHRARAEVDGLGQLGHAEDTTLEETLEDI